MLKNTFNVFHEYLFIFTQVLEQKKPPTFWNLVAALECLAP